MQNKSKIKQLIKNNCACYMSDKHGISNYCCLKDDPCGFFNNENPLPSCRYFENGVLPIDEKSEREYRVERNMGVEAMKTKPKVKCKKCSGTFEANSNRQHYCEICDVQNKKDKARLRMRKMRRKQA